MKDKVDGAENKVGEEVRNDSDTGRCGGADEVAEIEEEAATVSGRTEEDAAAVTTEQLEKLQREKAEMVALAQRVQADFDNYRKRMATEKEEIRAYALFDFMAAMIPILDDFDQAMKTASEEEVPGTYVEGLEMIRKKILQLFEQQGVSEIEAQGRVFDPHYHEAVMQTDEGEGEPNTVVDEFRKGYIMKGRILRPAVVKVYKGLD
ncbi:MAG: nucleotide exchange factor GrpE [Dethiobacteria bacterium]